MDTLSKILKIVHAYIPIDEQALRKEDHYCSAVEERARTYDEKISVSVMATSHQSRVQMRVYLTADKLYFNNTTPYTLEPVPAVRSASNLPKN